MNNDNKESKEDRIKNGKKLKAYRFKIIKFTAYIINPLVYLAFASLFWIIAGRMQD